MAFNVVDTSYSGTYSKYFIMQAMYGMDTLNKGLVYVASDIKKAHTIGRIDYSNPLKPRQAQPVANGLNPFVIDGRLLIPQSVDVYEEFNPCDLEENQLAEQLSDTILDRRVPAELQSQLVQLVLNRAAEQYENGIWMGSTAYAGVVAATDPRYQVQYFNGFMQRFVNDPLVNAASSPVAITTTNIFSIMDGLLQDATTTNKGLVTHPLAHYRLKYLMSPKTGNIYSQELRTGTDFKGVSLNDGEIPRWSNYVVEVVSGMPDDTIIFCNATDDINSNLWAGMNSQKDWDLKIERTRPQDETFFIQGKWKWDVNYGWPQEVFMYTTLTPASFIP